MYRKREKERSDEGKGTIFEHMAIPYVHFGIYVLLVLNRIPGGFYGGS